MSGYSGHSVMVYEAIFRRTLVSDEMTERAIKTENGKIKYLVDIDGQLLFPFEYILDQFYIPHCRVSDEFGGKVE